ncbi:SCO family protein [Sandaracinus amylolyticus]|uniref:Thioredoxin domain-containing protein n=1 Tax=Sandaracinus amylolyticus TaxID=927083 RepID=A0A0F6W029_9BACT|nr:SCO family protein [Sandaracinus amylolyticus]AKF04037.1 Hypothetical protein DB32_001186 [Sandaracinus amylolyticus]
MALGPEASEAEVRSRIDASSQDADRGTAFLLSLLDEAASVHEGRGTRQVTRIRGYVLLALARRGTPEEALPYVLEELESGRDAYLVAAAARAVVGLARPSAALAEPLRSALRNIRQRDDALDLDRYQIEGALPRFTTACEEIERALADLAARAADPPDDGCCRAPSAMRDERDVARDPTRLDGIRATDQSGAELDLGAHLRGAVSIVAFFYTRCENPNKCSLTISRLAGLQRALRAAGLGESVRVSAISYDPSHDTPALLKTYGASRGFVFDGSNRFLRVDPERFDEVARHLRLGVGYAGSIVNRHRIELYVLDARGRVVASFQRLRWDDAEVLACVERARADRSRRWTRPAASIGLSMLVALVPKCPACWLGYAGLFGGVGVGALPYLPWLLPALATLLVVHLAVLERVTRAAKGRELALLAGVGGTVTILLGRALDAPAPWLYVGAALVGLASFLASTQRARTFALAR